MTGIKFLDILRMDDQIKEKTRLWRNKKDVRLSMLNQHIISKNEHLKWLEKLEKNGNTKFWIVFTDNIPIGTAYLTNMNYEALSSEWGFYIGEDTHRGKGLSKSILQYLMNIFFGEMKFRLLITKVLSTNTRAVGIYKKFGFRKKNRLTCDGKKDVIIFEFTDKDWMTYKKRNLKVLPKWRLGH